MRFLRACNLHVTQVYISALLFFSSSLLSSLGNRNGSDGRLGGKGDVGFFLAMVVAVVAVLRKKNHFLFLVDKRDKNA